MALARSEIASLVSKLDSQDEVQAKAAAAALDALLYPKWGSGIISHTKRMALDEEHYHAVRESGAVEALLDALEGGTEFARAYAGPMLGSIKDHRALPALVAALSALSSDVRFAAVRGLWYFRERSTIPALAEVLIHDPSDKVRRGAADALGFIGYAEAVPALMLSYANGDKDDRVSALSALADIGDPRALPLAREALFDRVRRIRKTAKYALSRYDLLRRGEWKPRQ